jgi:hypothetical protein
MAEGERKRSVRNDMLHMCGVVLRCHQRCTSRRHRTSHEFATRGAPAAWASTGYVAEGVATGSPGVSGVVTDARRAILASLYGYSCKVVSTYMVEQKQEMGS